MPTQSLKRQATVLVEALEGRQLYSVVIAPAFGVEQVTYDAGGSQPAHPALFVILWGSDWRGLRSSESRQAEVAVRRLVATPFLGQTKQYGTDGRVRLGNGRVSFVYDGSDPASGAALNSAILPEAEKLYASGRLPSPGASRSYTPDYVVVTPLGVLTDNPNVGGFNTHAQVSDGTEYAIWTYTKTQGNGALGIDTDAFTYILSHEIAESVSHTYDVTANGYTGVLDVTHIADGEAQMYKFREANGVMVQSYWSVADGAFVVDNGTSLAFNLVPEWSGNEFVGKYDLTVDATQLGARKNGQLSVVCHKKTLSVMLDGQTSAFSTSEINSITLKTHADGDKVDVTGLPSSLNVTIQAV